MEREKKLKNLLLLRKKNLIGDLLEQAIGVFFLNWKEDDAPMVLNPYKYRHTDNRNMNIYPKLSELLLDEEEHIDYIISTSLRDLDQEDLDMLQALNEEAESLWNKENTMTESKKEVKKVTLKSYLEKKLTVSPKEAELIESVIKEYVQKKKRSR